MKVFSVAVRRNCFQTGELEHMVGVSRHHGRNLEKGLLYLMPSFLKLLS